MDSSFVVLLLPQLVGEVGVDVDVVVVVAVARQVEYDCLDVQQSFAAVGVDEDEDEGDEIVDVVDVDAVTWCSKNTK